MLKITPRGKVIGSMPQDEAEDTPVLLSLNAEPVGTETVKMSIDVVFQSVLLERPIGKGYWSIGSTGAELRFRAAGAAIGAHTAGSKISVKYKIANGKERTITAKVEPTVEVGEDVKASVGEFGFEGKTSAGGEAEYESHESPLAVIEKGDTVVWQQAITRGEKVVRDYLFGTLKLWADCKWGAKSKQGHVRLRNSAFFFNQEGTRLPGWKALLMEATLAMRDYKIPNRNGIELQFVDSDK